MAGLTLLTVTGMRPEAFALCERYMARQNYGGKVQWLVADDGEEPTQCTMDQQYHRVTPYWKPGHNTMRRNLLALTPYIRYDKVLIIEDDDWYDEDYLDMMGNELNYGMLAGMIQARYYNVAYRFYRIHRNAHHASLCQTALRQEAIPLLESICHNPACGEVDMALWADERVVMKRLFRPGIPPHSVGIKGMPGRLGINVGHTKTLVIGKNPHAFVADPNRTVIRAWLGADAELYRKYFIIQCHA